MAKWNNMYILKLSPDDIIHKSAKQYRDYLMLPDNQHFSQFNDDEEWPNVQDGTEPLGKLVMQDKLMIVAHATVDKVAGKSPEQLASWLKNICGLKEVGLITFKCCSVGYGSYLEMFKTKCATNNIKVGWLKGYRGGASTLAKSSGKPTEIISHNTSKGTKLGSDRFKILEGTHPYSIPDSRYFYDADEL